MLLLQILLKIADNHHRGPNFFNKIEQILQIITKEIKKYYSNFEIFNIFKYNKRFLLSLIELKILIFDKDIYNIIFKRTYFRINKYLQFFLPEIRSIKTIQLHQADINQICSDLHIQNIFDELPDNFYEARKSGENNEFLCQLIRQDSIVDFITYINKENVIIDAKIIQTNVYETNPFLLLQKEYSLIEYAAFCGSIQIFQYLLKNDAKINQFLWIFAIHGKNDEMINIIERKDFEDPQLDSSSELSYFESIKCNHNEIARYININLLNKDEDYTNKIIECSVKYCNFAFIQENMLNDCFFFFSIKCNNSFFINAFIKDSYNMDTDINKIFILYIVLNLIYQFLIVIKI